MGKFTVRDRVAASLRSSKANAFVRGDFERFGGYRQVSRALKELAGEGLLVKVGHGVYARARKSSLSGNAVPAADLLSIGVEALGKLGVKAGESRAMRALSERRSTQVPMALALSVDKRVTRKIGFGKRSITYDRG